MHKSIAVLHSGEHKKCTREKTFFINPTYTLRLNRFFLLDPIPKGEKSNRNGRMGLSYSRLEFMVNSQR